MGIAYKAKTRCECWRLQSVPEVTGRDELAEADKAAASKERVVLEEYRDQYDRFGGDDDKKSIVGFLPSSDQQLCVELNDHTYDYFRCFGDDIAEAKRPYR